MKTHKKQAEQDWGRRINPPAPALLCLLLVACDLPGIPEDFTPRSEEAGLPREPVRQVCDPGSRVCVGFDVQVCDDRGESLETELCPGESVCRQGACVSTKETCGDAVDLAISETFLTFEQEPNGKPSLRNLDLTNCSAEDLLIRTATIDTLTRQDGFPLFDFTRPGISPQGTRLGPGDTIRTALKFSPREVAWAEIGTLTIRAEGAMRRLTREVSLRSATPCLSVPPALFLGEARRGQRTGASSIVQNCGNVALHVEAGGPVGAQGEKAVWQIQGLEKAVTLKPGQSQPFSISYDPFLPGIWSANVDFSVRTTPEGPIFKTARTSSTIHVQSGKTEDACVSGTPPALVFRGQQWSPGSMPGQVSVAPFSEQRVFFPTVVAAQGWFLRAEFRAPPQSSQPQKRYDDQGKIVLTPVATGMAALSLWFYDPRGERLCQSLELPVSVIPQSALYVELQWSSPDDPVHGDGELGQGVDLDLHALTGSSWRSPDQACFPTARVGGEEACGVAGARMKNASATGSEPEVMEFDAQFLAQHDTLDLGVWVRSMGLYERACATLRVWHGGKLVATLPEPESAQDTLCPGARSLTRTQSFWRVGSLDLRTMTIDTTGSVILPQVPSP